MAPRRLSHSAWVERAETGDPFLYAFEAVGTPYVKVGFSRDPERRLAQVQALAPQRLRMLGLMPGGPADEALAHRRLAPWRHRGEWFDLNTAALHFAETVGEVLRPWFVVRLAAGYIVKSSDGREWAIGAAS